MAKLRKVMKEGTRRNAKELKELGFIDKVIEVSNEIKLNNVTPVELMAACSKLKMSTIIKPKIKRSMKLLNQTLGLIDDSNETAQVAAIKKIVDRAIAAEAKVKLGLDNVKKIVDLEKEIVTLKNEKQLVQDAASETFVNSQIEKGIFSEEKKDDLYKQAKKDLPGFKNFCDSLNGQFVDVTKKLGKPGEKGEKAKAKLIDQARSYHEADMAGTLSQFQNKVGDAAFKIAEDAYTEHMDAILKEE